MRSKGFTLWLMPSGAAFKKFSNLIKNLAQQYRAPIFKPHVTLLGEILQPEEECIRLTKKLVSVQKPFTVKLEQIDYQNYYFRMLFVKAKLTKPLLTLYTRAKKIFQINAPSLYMPHLSLLYGRFPVKTKEKIIDEIGENQSAEFKVSSLHLIEGGEVNDWHMVGEFPFR